MLDNIVLTINNKEYEYSNGITLEEISKDFSKDFKYPILLAKVNNRIKELDKVITDDCEIKFLDLTSREGNRTHISGLTFLLVYTVKKLFGDEANIIVEHSIDKGIYITTNFKLTESKVNSIKEEMNKLISADMPITKVTVDRLEAINYFEEIKDYSKSGVLKYNTNTFINLYRMGNLYNYFYNFMPISTKYLKAFDLTYIKDNGFVLRFPTPFIKNKIKEYTHHQKLFDTYKENRNWSNQINVKNSVNLNTIVSNGNIDELIRMAEVVQNNKLFSLATTIYNQRNNIKVVLIAGPSSSGKTTTSKKLCMYLKSNGLNPKVLSMDDYFVERIDNPKDEEGNPDYECLEALDLKLFNKQVAELLNNKVVKIPTYNFALGEKEYKREMVLEESDILVIEGIHALDVNILTNIPKENKYKIYVSPLTELNIDDHNRISTTDNRLLRRIIRDNKTRGYNVEHTLNIWPSVRNGEEKYIFPFQDEADYTFNTALIYEIGVLKTYVEPLLYSVPSTSEYYEEAKRLLNFLRNFLPIPADAIPEESILREFIGKSCFTD